MDHVIVRGPLTSRNLDGEARDIGFDELDGIHYIRHPLLNKFFWAIRDLKVDIEGLFFEMKLLLQYFLLDKIQEHSFSYIWGFIQFVAYICKI